MAQGVMLLAAYGTPWLVLEAGALRNCLLRNRHARDATGGGLIDLQAHARCSTVLNQPETYLVAVAGLYALAYYTSVIRYDELRPRRAPRRSPAASDHGEL